MTIDDQLQAWAEWRGSWACGEAPPSSIPSWMSRPHSPQTPPAHLSAICEVMDRLAMAGDRQRNCLIAAQVCVLFPSLPVSAKAQAIGVAPATYAQRCHVGRLLIESCLLIMREVA